MTWEACFTHEVWDGLRAWAQAAERRTLVDVLVCQRFCDVEEKGGYDHAVAAADAHRARLAALPDDVLADMVVDNASAVNSCTNGGHELHLCSGYCAPHSVAVDELCEAAKTFGLAESR